MVRCPVCGTENGADALFCARCTSPVAVVPLHELDEADHRRCLAALFSVLAETVDRASVTGRPVVDPDLWRAYLSAFWLRPETALVLYGEAIALRYIEFTADHPWLDLGCGDGIHAAIYGGWRFDETFDAFQSLDLASPDMYNRFDPAQFTAGRLREGRRIGFGIDIKETAVARARALGVFDKVLRADASALPLESGSIGVIFSNMLRDLGEPLPAVLAECRRVLRDDGVLLISAMTPWYAQELYFAPAARRARAAGEDQAARQLLKLDRGRSVFCQRQLSAEQWQEVLGGAGLRVESVRPTVGDAAIRFWDVGLRPFVHALLAQREAWSRAGVLGPVKRSLLNGLDYLLTPLVRTIAQGEPCMQLLEIRKA